MKYCTNCGASLEDQQVVCPACGAASSSAAVPQAGGSVAGGPGQAPHPPQQWAPQPGGPPQGAPPPYTAAPPSYGVPPQAAPPVYTAAPPPYGGMPPQGGQPLYAAAPPKKKKTGLIVALVIAGLLLAIVITGVVVAVRTFQTVAETVLEDDPGGLRADSDMGVAKDYVLHDLSFSVPLTLFFQEASHEDQLLFMGTDYQVQVSYSSTAFIVSSEAFAEETLAYMEAELSDAEDLRVSDVETVHLNGAAWCTAGLSSLRDTGETRYVDMYFYSTGTEQYSIAFGYNEDARDDALKESILSTLEVAAPEIGEDFDADATAAALVGQWDAEAGGYVIFYEDGRVEWYRDGSKDPDNMFYGTYEVTGPLVNLTDGKTSGFSMQIDFSESVIAGERSEGPGLREFEFSPHDGGWWVENLSAGSHNIFTRVL